MKLIGTVIPTVALCFLVHVKVEAGLKCFSWYLHATNCSGGNLMKIFTGTDKCRTVGNSTQCEVKMTGTNTMDDKTHFEFVKVPGQKRTCIQFTERDGTKYALKVHNGVKVTFEQQEQGCHTQISSEFLFKEAVRKLGYNKFLIYQPENTSKCLRSHCNGTLSLMDSKDVKEERKCFFLRRIP